MRAWLKSLQDSLRAHPDRWAISGIVALSVAAFARALIPGRILSPADIVFCFHPWRPIWEGAWNANPNFGDPGLVFHPFLVQAVREVSQGRFPLWNPYIFAGAPFLGSIQTGVLSPFNLPAYVLPLNLALALSAILKTCLSGLGTYWFLRLTAFRPISSFIGAVSFMFNGYVIAWLQFPLSSPAAILPLLFALAEYLRQRGTWRAMGLLGLAVGGAMLGGHPETSFHVVMAAGIYTLWRSLRHADPMFMARFFGAVALGISLSAVQTFTFLEYLRESSVLAYRLATEILEAMHYSDFVQTLAPTLTSGINEASGTVGVLPWLLLPVALLGNWRREETRFFSFLAIGCMGAILANPVMQRLLSMLPLFSLSANGRLILVLGFCLCVLAAVGIEVLLDPPPDRKKLLIAASVFAVLLIGFVLKYAWPNNFASSIALSPDGKLLASAHSLDHAVRIWDAESGGLLRTYGGRSLGVVSVEFSPNGNLLASGGEDGSVHVFGAEQGEILSPLKGHKESIWGLAFSRDSRRLAATYGKAGVRVWDLTSGKSLMLEGGHAGEALAVAFLPDGKHIVSSGMEGTARLWDVESGRGVRRFRGHAGAIWSLAAFGRTLVTASEDGTVRFWDVDSGETVRTLKSSGKKVWSVAISRDGRLLVSGGEDGKARIWDAENGQLMREIRQNAGEVWDVAISSDGKKMAATTNQGSIKIWDVEKGSLIASCDTDVAERSWFSSHRRQIPLAVATFVFLAIGGLFAIRRGLLAGVTGGQIAVLTFIELAGVMPFAAAYNPVIPKKDFYPEPPAVSFLKKQEGHWRVSLGVPNIAGLYGLCDVSGHDAVTPLRMERLVYGEAKTLGLLGNAALMFPPPDDSHLLDFLNVRYVLLHPGAPRPGKNYRKVYDGRGAAIYENTDVLPRVLVVPRARFLPNDESILELVRSGEVDFRREVVLREADRPDSSAPRGRSAGFASIEVYEPAHVRIKAQTDVPAYLVLADRIAPGWKARVDGKPVQLLCANYAFRAVRLPEGEHNVEFDYRPLSFRAGVLLSVLALLLTVALIGIPARLIEKR